MRIGPLDLGDRSIQFYRLVLIEVPGKGVVCRGRPDTQQQSRECGAQC